MSKFEQDRIAALSDINQRLEKDGETYRKLVYRLQEQLASVIEERNALKKELKDLADERAKMNGWGGMP